MKTNLLRGPALNWAVALAEQLKPELSGKLNALGTLEKPYTVVIRSSVDGKAYVFAPESHWVQGGAIIEREWVLLTTVLKQKYGPDWMSLAEGESVLQLFLRCHVALKLGDEVEIPAELMAA